MARIGRTWRYQLRRDLCLRYTSLAFTSNPDRCRTLFGSQPLNGTLHFHAGFYNSAPAVVDPATGRIQWVIESPDFSTGLAVLFEQNLTHDEHFAKKTVFATLDGVKIAKTNTANYFGLLFQMNFFEQWQAIPPFPGPLGICNQGWNGLKYPDE